MEGPVGIPQKLTSISHLLTHHLGQTPFFLSRALSSSAGKGNYWTLDPNCEKMFDNGTSEGRGSGGGRRALSHRRVPRAWLEPRRRSWSPWAPPPLTCGPRRPRPRPRPRPASPVWPRPWVPWLVASVPFPGAWRETFPSGDPRRSPLTAPRSLARRPASPLASRRQPPASASVTSSTAGRGPKFDGKPGTVPSVHRR